MTHSALELPQAQPLDRHNRELVELVAPPGWVNPTPSGRYNLVVLGAGTAGLVAAAVAAGMGGKVALIERELMGGDCLNVGCVPSKALIRAARAAAEVRGAARFGVRVGGPVEVDFGAVMERMRRLRASIAPHDSAARFRELGVDVYLGSGRFTGPDSIEVDGRRLEFARACIATGARPFTPPIKGLEAAGYHTNATVFSLTELPRRLGIVGAGPIGCELAQAFARFGARVSLVEMASQVLVREDREAAAIVQRALVEDGVELVLDAKLLEVQRTAGGARELLVETPQGTRTIEVDELLMGIGRAPNVEGIGLEAAGVDFDPRQGVHVDDHLRTTSKRIYAAGDVCSVYKFTHTADAAAGIVIRNALFFGRARASALTIPWATYTDPEIAHVGLYEHEARERGLEVETLRVELSAVDRAVLESDGEGFLKVHTQGGKGRGKGRILGATLVAPHAGDLISEITLAMVSGAGLQAIAGTIHPYPTRSAAFKQAANLQLKNRLTPLTASLLKRFLAWRR